MNPAPLPTQQECYFCQRLQPNICSEHQRLALQEAGILSIPEAQEIIRRQWTTEYLPTREELTQAFDEIGAVLDFLVVAGAATVLFAVSLVYCCATIAACFFHPLSAFDVIRLYGGMLGMLGAGAMMMASVILLIGRR